MKEALAVTIRTAEGKPKYRKTAAELIERCREFYRDPENERAFQEWKKEQGRERH